MVVKLHEGSFTALFSSLLHVTLPAAQRTCPWGPGCPGQCTGWWDTRTWWPAQTRPCELCTGWLIWSFISYIRLYYCVCQFMGVRFTPHMAAKMAEHFHAEELQRQVKWDPLISIISLSTINYWFIHYASECLGRGPCQHLKRATFLTKIWNRCQ